MSSGDYLAGLVFFAGTWGAVAAATWRLARRRLAHLRGAELVLAAALIYTAGLIAVHLVPLALGILTRGSALATAGLALIALSVYALGRQLRAPRATALLTAAVVVALPAVMVQGVDRVKPDAMTLACFGAGLVFLV